MTAIRQTTTVKPNGVIELQSPELPPGQTVEVIVLVGQPARGKREGVSFLKVASELKLDGPPDWSDRFEEYLEQSRRNDARS
jgi:hypothetical protein